MKVKDICPWAGSTIRDLLVRETVVKEFSGKHETTFILTRYSNDWERSELTVDVPSDGKSCYLHFEFPLRTAWIYMEESL